MNRHSSLSVELKGKVFVPFALEFSAARALHQFRLSSVFAAHTCIYFHSHLCLYQRHPVIQAGGWSGTRKGCAAVDVLREWGRRREWERKGRRKRKRVEACEGLALWHFVPLCLGWLLYRALQQAVTSRPIKWACFCFCFWLSLLQAAAALNPHTDRATFIYTIPDSFQEVLKIIKSVLFSWNKICQTFSLL